MNRTETYDIVIIGAGPAGLSCAIEAQRAGMKYLVLDKGGIVSSIQQYQRNMFFFSTPELLEIGGVPFVVSTMRPTSLDCVNYYRTVSDYYKLNLSLYQPVVSSARHNGEFMVKTGRGNLRQLFENYNLTLRHLAAEGVTTVIYNFMPVLDWIRTDMHHVLPDGSESIKWGTNSPRRGCRGTGKRDGFFDRH